MWNQRDITVHRALTLPMTGLALKRWKTPSFPHRPIGVLCLFVTSKQEKKRKEKR